MSPNVAVAATVPVEWTEHGIPIRNLWHMLLYAWDEMPANHAWTMQQAEVAPTLDALFAILLLEWMRQRMRIGLGCNYAVEDRAIRGIRGRVDFAKSLKQGAFERGESFCHFHQYSPNVPKNQIIRSTMARLIRIGRFGSDDRRARELRHALRVVTQSLASINLIELNLDLIRRQQMGRDDRDYRLMLAICELILLRQMPLRTEGQTPLPQVDQKSVTLYKIYEKFIANFYRLHLKEWSVQRQSRLQWHEKATSKHLPSMTPDLQMQNRISGQRIVLDTKFTARSILEHQFGKQIFNSDHLYQMYAYLKSQEHLSEHHRRTKGILLYPAIDSEFSERIELQDLLIRFESVDLAAPWQEIETRLLGLISSI